LEVDPDDRHAQDHRQVAEVALGQAAAEVGDGAAQPGRFGDEAGIDLDAHRRPPGAEPVGSWGSTAGAPGMADTTASVVASLVVNWAALRPRRSTTMRSLTSNTSLRLWLMTTTPRFWRRSVRMSSSTWLVWLTPRAAVGSSSITILGAPMVA